MSPFLRYIAPLPVAFLFGILAHHGLFRQVELDRYPLQVASVGLVLYLALVRTLQFSFPEYHCYCAALAIAVKFASGLCLSTLVYRALFHPLRGFPGPFCARLSKFWAAYQTAKVGGRWYKINRQLHAQYGDYVRIGPRDLSITDPDAIIPILGPSTKTSKGPFYGCLEQSIHTTLDKDYHRQRRRVWDNGFKIALEGFAPRIEAITDDLLSLLKRHSRIRTPVSVNEVAQRFSFDVMCALAFGEPAGYLIGNTTPEDEAIFKIMHDSLDMLGLLLHTPWIIKALDDCAVITGPMKRLALWSAEKVEQRRKMKTSQSDLMGHLMAHSHDNAVGRTELYAESRLIVGAGSDTSAAALTIIFAYLAAHPAHLARLRAEVAPAVAMGTFNLPRSNMPLLDATINECMRLHPPITWAPSRVTGPAGLEIARTANNPATAIASTAASVHIPPNTIVSIPHCTITRDPRNFPDPDAFRPERWLAIPTAAPSDTNAGALPPQPQRNNDLIQRREAFMPFLIGPYQCPGKALAMMELRSAVARVVTSFDIAWLPTSCSDKKGAGRDGRKGELMGLAGWLEGFTDHFTVGLPRLELGFSELVETGCQ